MTADNRCAASSPSPLPSRVPPIFGQRATARIHALGERGRAAATGDRGNTLVELMVGMVLMTVAGAIFTTAVVTLSKTTNQAQAIGDATQQNNQAFQTLDRTARYASAISLPGQTGDGWWVELRDTSTGSEVCTQLRTNTASKQLQSRSWTVTGPTTYTARTSWIPLASGLTNTAAATNAAEQPFRLLDLSPTAVRQQLQITLVTSAGPASARSSSKSQFTVSAANSSRAVPSSFCQQVPRS